MPRIPRRIRLAVALAAAAAAGAAFGLVTREVSIHMGGGWMRSALAAGSVALASLLLVHLARVGLESPLRLALRLALGPLLFAGGALLFWRLGPPRGILVADAIRGALALPESSLGVAAAGGVIGLAAAVFLDPQEENAPFAGAAFGIVPGAFLGAIGGWSSPLWYAAPAYGALAALVLALATVWASRTRLAPRQTGKDPLLATYGIGIASAVAGAVLVGGSPHAARWASLGLDKIEMGDGRIESILLDLIDLAPAIARTLGFEAGWIAGAAAGAILAYLLILGWWSLVAMAVGAVVGLGDWLADGRILGALLEGGLPGAATGALVGASVGTLREDEGAGLLASVALALPAGALAHLAAIWTGTGAFGVAGAIFGFAIAFVARKRP